MRQTQMYNLPNEIQRRIKDQARYLPGWQDLPLDVKARISAETGSGSLASVNRNVAQHNFLQRLADLLKEMQLRSTWSSARFYVSSLTMYRSFYDPDKWTVQYIKLRGNTGNFYMMSPGAGSQRSQMNTILDTMSSESSRSPLPFIIQQDDDGSIYRWPLYERDQLY